MGCPARLLRQLRRHGHQPVEGPAAVQLLRLVGPRLPGVRLLRHPRRGHGGQEPGCHGAHPAQRPRPVHGPRGTLLQRGAAVPAPHQRAGRRHQRVLVRPLPRAAPTVWHVQLVAHRQHHAHAHGVQQRGRHGHVLVCPRLRHELQRAPRAQRHGRPRVQQLESVLQRIFTSHF